MADNISPVLYAGKFDQNLGISYLVRDSENLQTSYEVGYAGLAKISVISIARKVDDSTQLKLKIGENGSTSLVFVRGEVLIGDKLFKAGSQLTKDEPFHVDLNIQEGGEPIILLRIDFCSKNIANFNIAFKGGDDRKPWGAYYNIGDSSDSKMSSPEQFKLKVIKVDPAASLSLQLHELRSEVWVALGPEAVDFRCHDKTDTYSPGEIIYIPRGAIHRMANTGTKPTYVAELQFGDACIESDIKRLEIDPRFAKNY
jgi:mannose-6-phosphate isomerase